MSLLEQLLHWLSLLLTLARSLSWMALGTVSVPC